MKKLMTTLLCLLLLASCGTKQDDIPETSSEGTKQLKVFEKASESESDIFKIGEALTKTDPELSLEMAEVEPGWLNGFSEDVTGFTKGVVVAPIIGSIPYVAYVFESEDPEALLKELDEKHNMRWNICIEADEKVSAIKGNLVFYIMCSNEE